MSEKEFKVDDKVRVIDAPFPEWMQNMPALPDTIFKVEGMQNGKLILSMECCDARFIVDAEHFELVETSEQSKDMGNLSYELISEAESYLVNQTFGDNYIRVTSKRFDIKGEIKNYDPKTAFLNELSELLRKYDAKIRWSIGLTYEDRTRSSANIEVHTPNFDHYFSGETGVTLTADNVFNYDKE